MLILQMSMYHQFERKSQFSDNIPELENEKSFLKQNCYILIISNLKIPNC